MYVMNLDENRMRVEDLLKKLKEEKKSAPIFIKHNKGWYPIERIYRVLDEDGTILIETTEEPI